MSNKTRSEKRIKQDAQLIKKNTGCTHSEALDIAVKKIGFSSFQTFKSSLKKSNQNIPEGQLRSELAKRSIDYATFLPTKTGLEKSILDATAPMRSHFKSAQFHDYDSQKQEPSHKVKADAFFVRHNETVKTIVSLYRPKTKNGDPRMWFKGLKDFASPGDLIAIVFYQKNPYLLNLSNIHDLSFFQDFLDSITEKNTVVEELLNKLKVLAKEPISFPAKGDTSIGMALESALGIPPNSNKKPDYKGIELKSSRKRSMTRKNLFAQVPLWEISTLSSSKEILDRYGYQRDQEFKLYCTISSLKPNPQGLQLSLDSNGDLHEVHTKDGSIVIWPEKLLQQRLLEKHAETFWIEADSEIKGDKELFYLKTVIHTKSPLKSQLTTLINEGVITVDHLIKRTATGGAKEKGPIFKIKPSCLNLLFPSPIKYNLIS